MTRPVEPPARGVRRPPEHEVHLPSPGDLAVLGVALTAVSTSGPLIAATAAPALAIAFWRNALALVVLAPATWLRRRAEVAALTGREWRVMVLAGVLLAAHFATWIPSLSYTSVASATALVATQPVWAGLIARAQGRHVPARAWAGIGVAVAGAALLTGVDVQASREALFGDGLALVGGAFAALYISAGSSARRTVSTTTYTTVAYGTTALILLVVCLVAGLPLGGYSGDDWLRLVALTVGAQLLGHSLFNRVLDTTSATVVSLCILLEIPGAALIAAVFLGQVPPLAAIPAAVLLIGGIALTVTSAPVVAVPAE